MILFVINNFFAVSSILSSTSEFPIGLPAAFKKVFDIPPPTTTEEDLVIKFLITSNFVDTFEPPTTLIICLFYSNADSKFLISSENKSPAHAFLDNSIAPKVEAAVL